MIKTSLYKNIFIPETIEESIKKDEISQTNTSL